MYKAYKYRLYPNPEQLVKIDNQLNCGRFVYNLALETKIHTYKYYRKNLSAFDLHKQLTDLKKELGWLQEVDSQVLVRTITNMCEAYVGFFKGKGYPKFKSKYSKQSFTCPNNRRRVDFNNNTVTIPKIKNIPAIISQKFIGEIKQITISKTPTGKYFASVLVKTSKIIPLKPLIKNSVGIDLGLSHFIITSNGVKTDNPRYLRASIERLKVLQHRASKKAKGSQNRRKALHKVALLHERISNQRIDFLHKVSSKLVYDNQVDTICMENLAVKNMVKNHKLAQAISDVSWGKFVELVKYKCEWSGKNLILIDRFFPSSKTCSDCGVINQELKLSDREWTCACGSTHDRDINASINIKNSGVRCSGEPMEKSAIVDSMK
jgi:putative transposase